MEMKDSRFSVSRDAREDVSCLGLSAGEAGYLEIGAGFRRVPWIKRLLAGCLPFRVPVRVGLLGQRQIDDVESDDTSILSRDVLFRLFNIALIAGAFEAPADASGRPAQGKPLATQPAVRPGETLGGKVIAPSSRHSADCPDAAPLLKRLEPHLQSEPLLSPAPVSLDGDVGGNPPSLGRARVRPQSANGNPEAWLPVGRDMAPKVAPLAVPAAFPDGVTRNIIMGGGGDDVLYATRQSDVLKGGQGDDRYVFQPGTGQDVIQDTGGNDTVDLNAYRQSIVAHLDTGAVVLPGSETPLTEMPTSQAPGRQGWAIQTGFGFPQVGFFDWAWGSFIQDVIAWSPGQLENVITGSGNDWIRGNAADNRLDAGAGNDWLQGGAGQDTLLGGLGDDVYFFELGDGQDVVFDDGASSDTDVLRFGAGIRLTEMAFFQNGDDLQIAYSPANMITIRNQSNAGIERFEFADGSFLSDHDVNQIIQTMASYAVNQGLSLTSFGDAPQNLEMLTLLQSNGQAA